MALRAGGTSSKGEGVMALPFAGRTLLVDRAGDGLALLEPEAAMLWRQRAAGPGRAFARRLGRELARGRRAGRPPLPAAPADDGAAGFSCTLGGAAFEVACADPALAPMVRALLAPLAGRGAEGAICRLVLSCSGHHLMVAAGGRVLAATADPDEALGLLVDALVDRAWCDARWMAVAHAGAVARADGALLLPGISGAGKSTLVAGLVAAGWQFLSDDVAPLDAVGGTVAPVPLALSAREAVWPLLERILPDAPAVAELDFEEGLRRFLDLGRHAPAEPVPLRGLLVPCFDPCGTPGLEALGPGEALQALVEARCWLSREPALLQRLLGLLETVPAARARYRSLAEGVALARAFANGERR